MILGISGTFGAGKDTIADYLIDKGWQHISLADLIRAEAKKRGMGLDRDSLRNLGNILAKEDGEEALAKKAIASKKNDNLAISAVRKIGEVDYLIAQNDFKLIFVDAPIELRHDRMIKRGREGDTEMTIDQLKEKEYLEMSGKSSQRLDYCKEKADYLVDNSNSIEELYKKIDQIIEKNN